MVIGPLQNMIKTGWRNLPANCPATPRYPAYFRALFRREAFVLIPVEAAHHNEMMSPTGTE